MSTITNLLNTGYSSLFGNSSPNVSTDPAADALLNLGSTSNNNDQSGGLGDAFLLDLSPQAQQVLAGLNGNTTPNNDSGSLGSLFGLGGFLLTSDQQKQLSDILAKYKDAPYTQDTFNLIQGDLDAAGLSPQQLSLQDKLKSFNPVGLLIDALDGKDPNSSDSNSSGLAGMLGGDNSDQDQKSQTYIQQIIKQWQSISSTYDPNAIDPAAATSGA